MPLVRIRLPCRGGAAQGDVGRCGVFEMPTLATPWEVALWIASLVFVIALLGFALLKWSNCRMDLGTLAPYVFFLAMIIGGFKPWYDAAPLALLIFWLICPFLAWGLRIPFAYNSLTDAGTHFAGVLLALVAMCLSAFYFIILFIALFELGLLGLSYMGDILYLAPAEIYPYPFSAVVPAKGFSNELVGWVFAFVFVGVLGALPLLTRGVAKSSLRAARCPDVVDCAIGVIHALCLSRSEDASATASLEAAKADLRTRILGYDGESYNELCRLVNEGVFLLHEIRMARLEYADKRQRGQRYTFRISQEISNSLDIREEALRRGVKADVEEFEKEANDIVAQALQQGADCREAMKTADEKQMSSFLHVYHDLLGCFMPRMIWSAPK
jgi:hypothetical protein